MPAVPADASILGSDSCSQHSRRFGYLRGLQWRIGLGILPSSPSASIDDLRRVTADSRRRYATLRRKLLIDPHVSREEISSSGLVMDNPLSQNPDSMWGRFFQNAELERMLDQDLTRLYPERGSYFQASGCQGMLRRILLLWCLTHSEHGYRQGMHELLAPLLYVLHFDIERLAEVRKAYDDHFSDKFDAFSYHEDDLTYKFGFKKFSEDGNGFGNGSADPKTLSELDPDIQTIVLLGDAYGAEGELGVVLSEKFMEHDAYSMFDALLSGAGGAIAMAEFFNPSPFRSLRNGVAPVIEASRAIYHLLSIADSSLYSHLVELGVEPQYFALRWLRVLFGREFPLEGLLIIWDEIFAHENVNSSREINGDPDLRFEILESPRGAFICAFAVSMILNLRSSLLACEIATASLQKLLNYPDDIKLEKLLEKASSLHSVAMNASFPLSHSGLISRNQQHRGGSTASPDSASSKATPNMVRDSYWEKKWRDLHKQEESKPSVRRSLLEELEQQLRLDEDAQDKVPDERASNEEHLSDFPDPSASAHGGHENESEISSTSSNSYGDDDDAGPSFPSPELATSFPLPVSELPAVNQTENSAPKLENGTKTRKETVSKFQWLRSFGRRFEEGSSQKTSKHEEVEVCNDDHKEEPDASISSKVSLKNLGQSMLENIQVIESAFQLDNRGQTGLLENIAKNGLVGKGQVTALAALKELRKISNLLSEM